MSYTYEKNPNNGKSELVISGWENGIGDSPYVGHQMLQNMNVSYETGGAYLNIKRNNSTYAVSGPTNHPTYIVQDQRFPKNLYAVDLAGVVWQSTNGGISWAVVASSPTTGAQGNGIAVWNGYLIVARNGFLDAIQAGSSGTTGAWTSGFATITNDANALANHFLLIANDTRLYMCNGTAIASLTQITTFNPGSGGTFSYNDTALVLPFQYYNNTIATGMCELGNNLLVAAGNYIYPWDKNSPSYNLPIPFPEPVYKIYNIDNYVYCFAGISTGLDYNLQGRGNIYLYNGYRPTLFKKIPDLSGSYISGDAQRWFIGGVTTYYKKLLFGVRSASTVAPSGAFNGVYSLDTDTAVLNFEYTDSQGTGLGTSLTTALCMTYGISDLTVPIQSFSSGWTDNNGNFGFGITDSSGNPYTTSTIITDLIPVGTNLQQKTFGQIEFKFNQPFMSGDTISAYIRGSLSSSFSNAVIVNNYTSSGSDGVSFIYPTPIQNLQWLQIQLVLGSVAGGSRCQLKEIRLIP